MLEARLRAIKTAAEAISTELARLESEARRRLGDLRAALEGHPAEAREMLSKIFSAPLKFTPEGNRFKIEGEVAAVTALFGGAPKSASPASLGTLLLGPWSSVVAEFWPPRAMAMLA